MRGLNRWGNKYAGFLLVLGRNGHPRDSYFTYNPPWTGEYTGYNVIFDMGMMLGEAVLASCPKLRWDVDPVPEMLPRTANMLNPTARTNELWGRC